MTVGIMEVNLVDAHGLTNSDFLRVKSTRALLPKSTIAKGQGNNPKWNEKFKFRVDYPGADEQSTLVLKIMDHDTFSADDYIGQTKIYLKEVLELGVENGTSEVRPQKYSVVDSSQSFCGDIRVGITFTPRVETETYAQEFGGWKQSQW